MHILIIPSWYKTPEEPIKGTFFEEQARMLQKKGYKVGVFCPEHAGNFSVKSALKQFVKKDYPKDFIDNGIPTMYSYSCELFPSRFQKLNYWFAGFMGYITYKKYTKKYGKPDIIHAHSVFIGGWIARYISKKESIKYVFTEHTNSVLYSQWITTDKVTKDVVKKTFSDAKIVTLPSAFFKQALIDIHNISPDNVTVIPNLVNPIFFESFSIKKKSNPFIISYIASLDHRKQQMLLIKALVLIIEKGYDVKLNLLGDGPDKSELMKYVIEKNIQHLVTFMGNQNRQIVKKEIDDAHLVVSASKQETFGLSIVEAFACGRPVVSIDSGGPRETVTKENGILIKENTIEKLAEAIISVINNYENYNQEEIKNNCFIKYSENAIWEMLEPIYKQITIKN